MENILIILLVIIGIAMMYLGGVKAPKFMMPPFLSGVAFLVIAGLYKVNIALSHRSIGKLTSFFSNLSDNCSVKRLLVLS